MILRPFAVYFAPVSVCAVRRCAGQSLSYDAIDRHTTICRGYGGLRLYRRTDPSAERLYHSLFTTTISNTQPIARFFAGQPHTATASYTPFVNGMATAFKRFSIQLTKRAAVTC